MSRASLSNLPARELERELLRRAAERNAVEIGKRATELEELKGKHERQMAELEKLDERAVRNLTPSREDAKAGEPMTTKRRELADNIVRAARAYLAELEKLDERAVRNLTPSREDAKAGEPMTTKRRELADNIVRAARAYLVARQKVRFWASTPEDNDALQNAEVELNWLLGHWEPDAGHAGRDAGDPGAALNTEH